MTFIIISGTATTAASAKTRRKGLGTATAMVEKKRIFDAAFKLKVRCPIMFTSSHLTCICKAPRVHVLAFFYQSPHKSTVLHASKAPHCSRYLTQDLADDLPSLLHTHIHTASLSWLILGSGVAVIIFPKMVSTLSYKHGAHVKIECFSHLACHVLCTM